MSEKVHLKLGFGYWDISVHPIGGSFKRADENFIITIDKEIDRRYNRNCSHTGIDKNGKKVAFDIQHTFPCDK